MKVTLGLHLCWSKWLAWQRNQNPHPWEVEAPGNQWIIWVSDTYFPALTVKFSEDPSFPPSFREKVGIGRLSYLWRLDIFNSPTDGIIFRGLFRGSPMQFPLLCVHLGFLLIPIFDSWKQSSKPLWTYHLISQYFLYLPGIWWLLKDV